VIVFAVFIGNRSSDPGLLLLVTSTDVSGIIRGILLNNSVFAVECKRLSLSHLSLKQSGSNVFSYFPALDLMINAVDEISKVRDDCSKQCNYFQSPLVRWGVLSLVVVVAL
jgi:hypothetical protein